jgi:predicted glycoside hydrolase/deacetylase ChbG (UPF0249 family)
MIICADDYGLREDIDQAILELCQSRRLSGVSCMVALERCGVEALGKLLTHQAEVDIGLHLCLADETLPRPVDAAPDKSPPYFAAHGTYLRRALAGRIQPREAFQQASQQYGVFLQKCGRRPDFIDGHLHAHQLPGVRDGLIQFVLSLPADQRPYIRNTRGPGWKGWRARLPMFKAAMIGVFGRRMHADLVAARLRTNEGFTGIYDFREWRCYPRYFPRFAALLPDPNGLLVVHPGGQEDWRRQELATLREFPFSPGSPNRFQPPASTTSGNH